MKRFLATVPPLVPAASVGIAAGWHVSMGGLWPTSTLRLVGLLPAVIAIVAVVAASIAQKRAGTSPEPWHETSALVTTGIYARTRNPFYLAYLLAQLGLGLILGWWALVALLPLTYLGLHIVIAEEEAHLRHAFPEAFETYCNQTRRWI